MPMLSVYVSDDDMRRLLWHSAQLGRTPEELAEAAVSEGICNANRENPMPMPPPSRVHGSVVGSAG